MPNQASHAGHVAERTCVICRQKKFQPELFRFVMLRDRYVLDPQRKLPGRGYYCCQKEECLEKLEKWIYRYLKRKRRSV